MLIIDRDTRTKKDETRRVLGPAGFSFHSYRVTGTVSDTGSGCRRLHPRCKFAGAVEARKNHDHGPGNIHGDPSRHDPGLYLHNASGRRGPDHGSRDLDRRLGIDHPRVHDPRALEALRQAAVAAVVLPEGFARPGLVRSWRSSRTREQSRSSIIYACTFPPSLRPNLIQDREGIFVPNRIEKRPQLGGR